MILQAVKQFAEGLANSAVESGAAWAQNFVDWLKIGIAS